MSYDLKTLVEFVEEFRYDESSLPVSFDEPYNRISIFKDDKIEIIVICYVEGQASSVHHHEDSCCVVKVIRGKILEIIYDDIADVLEFKSNHVLKTGDISGLDSYQIHQLSNMSKAGSVLLNFYSPPFTIASS